MTHLFIQPTDVLVFRDGRPFDAGSDHLAGGPFPPMPPTLYGALRSALLSQNNAVFNDPLKPDFGLAGTAAGGVAGQKSGLGTLALTSLSLARRVNGGIERLYPIPLDLLKRKTKEEDASGDPDHVFLRPTDRPAGMKTNLPNEGLQLLHPLPTHHVNTFYEATSELLTETDWDDMLAGHMPAFTQFIKQGDVYCTEPRTHVSLRGESDATFTGTAQEGKLFTVEFNRLATDVGLAVSLEANNTFADAGLLRLGGESRPAHYETIPLPPPDNSDLLKKAKEDLLKKAKENGKIRLILTTPAPFANGWLPDGIQFKDLMGTLRETKIRLHLKACAVGRPVNFGGWDIVRRRPKTACPAVPAGSVYFMQLKEPTKASDFFAAFDGKSLLDGDKARQGLGIVRLGIW